MSAKLAKQILLVSNYWIVNKCLLYQLGGVTIAFFLSNLCEAETLFGDDEGWFFQTIEKIEEITLLTRREQENAIKKLLELDLIQIELRGLPRKRYFRIKYDELLKLLEKYTESRISV